MLTAEELNQIIKDAIQLVKKELVGAVIASKDFDEAVIVLADKQIDEHERRYMKEEPKQ